MKKPRLIKWKMSDNITGLLFFAQVLEEILFHHTVDSFKSPALNTHSCVLELQSLAFELRNGVIKQGAMTHVLEELESRIKSDPVLEDDQRKLFETYLNHFKDNRSQPDDLIATTDALLTEIESGYWEGIKSKLNKLLETGEEKGEIIQLSKIFSNEIELLGFSKDYLYFETLSFFFNEQQPPNIIESLNQLNDFFGLFAKRKNNYKVLFRANTAFGEFKDYTTPFEINIWETLPADFNLGSYQGQYIKNDDQYPLFIHFPKIEAKDRFSARAEANSKLDFFADICSFHDHKSEFLWRRDGLVRLPESDNITHIKPPPAPMKRGVASRLISVESLEKSIEIMAGIHFDSSSMYLFSKAINYHRSAIQASTSENQLVSLWAAIEGFLPPPKQNENQVRIQQYSDYLLPPLVLTYTKKIFNSVRDSLYYGGNNIREYIEGIEVDGDFFDKATCLLVSDDLKDKRDRIYGMLDNHPLLKYRCYWCNEHFRNNKRIRKSISKHRERAKWHIQRIYTTRNQIVHSARSLPYLHTLVENLHTYFDILLSSIINIGIKAISKISIKTAIKQLQVHEKNYLSSLEGDKILCNNSNYKKMLFID